MKRMVPCIYYRVNTINDLLEFSESPSDSRIWYPIKGSTEFEARTEGGITYLSCSDIDSGRLIAAPQVFWWGTPPEGPMRGYLGFDNGRLFLLPVGDPGTEEAYQRMLYLGYLEIDKGRTETFVPGFKYWTSREEVVYLGKSTDINGYLRYYYYVGVPGRTGSIQDLFEDPPPISFQGLTGNLPRRGGVICASRVTPLIPTDVQVLTGTLPALSDILTDRNLGWSLMWIYLIGGSDLTWEPILGKIIEDRLVKNVRPTPETDLTQAVSDELRTLLRTPFYYGDGNGKYLIGRVLKKKSLQAEIVERAVQRIWESHHRIGNSEKE